MSWMLNISLALSLLIAIDGLAGLLYRDKLEGVIKEYFPGLDIKKLAMVEIAGGCACAALIFLYARSA